jgi:hypothetical protein
VAAAQSALAWRPAVSMIEGLRLTVDAYRQTLEPCRTAHSAGPGDFEAP